MKTPAPEAEDLRVLFPPALPGEVLPAGTHARRSTAQDDSLHEFLLNLTKRKLRISNFSLRKKAGNGGRTR